MKKYSFYFYLMILTCTTLITTSCSDDDDDPKHPYQEVMDDATPRFIFGDMSIDLKREKGSLYAIEGGGTYTGAGMNREERNITINFVFEGDPVVGVKKEAKIRIYQSIPEPIIYEVDQISKFEILKYVERTDKAPGKIWIVAEIDNKELIFVNELYSLEDVINNQ